MEVATSSSVPMKAYTVRPSGARWCQEILIRLILLSVVQAERQRPGLNSVNFVLRSLPF